MARSEPRGACMRAAQLGVLGLLALSCTSGAVAQADDWSLTRPSAHRPASSGSRASAHAKPASAAAPASNAAGQAARRYLRVALADPLQLTIVERLAAAYAAQPEGTINLQRELDSKALAEPRNPRVRLLIAQLERLRGHVDEARAAFRAASELDGGASVLRAWADFERQQHEEARATQLLEQALARAGDAPTRVELTRELADLALEAGDFAGAEKHFRALARASGQDLGSALAYARALMARNEPARAAAEYRHALETLRGDARVVPLVLAEKAKAELAAGRFEDALATLARARALAVTDAGLRADADETLLEVHRRRETLPELAEQLAHSRRPEDRVLGARAYDELGQDADALAGYRAALAQRPGDAELVKRIIHVLSRAGRIDEVISEYRTLVRIAPNDGDALVELVRLLDEAGRKDEALSLLARAGREHPRDVRLHQRSAELYAKWKKDAELAAELRLLARLDPGEPTHWIALGEAELAQGHADLAREQFRRATTNAGDSAAALARLGEIYLDHDMLDDALASYERARTAKPNDLQIERGWAQVLERANRWQEAALAWQRVIELAGADPAAVGEARKHLIDVWAELGELPQRIAAWERELAAAPGQRLDVESARGLAAAYQRYARLLPRGADVPRVLRLAEDVLVRVLAAAPDDVESLRALERLRARRGDVDGALAVLEQLVTLDPRGASAHLTRMAELARSVYRDADALRYAERAVQAAPNDADAQQRLGDSYRARGEGARALAAYDRALELEPQRSALRLRIAELALAQGERERAEAAFLAVLRAAPDDETCAQAFRGALAQSAATGHYEALEQTLSAALLAHRDRVLLRKLLVELYDVTTRALEARTDADASEQLEAIARRALRPLLEALAGRDPGQVRASLDVLGRARQPLAALPLLAFAEQKEHDLGLRRRALAVAFVTPHPELVPRLTVLARSSEVRMRESATWAIGQHEGATAHAALDALRASDAPAVRAQALLGLARNESDGDAERVQTALTNDVAPLVRRAAAMALSTMSGPSVLPALRGATLARDAQLVRLAWLGLALRRDPSLAAALASLVFRGEDRFPEIGCAGLRALDVGLPLALPRSAPAERPLAEQLEADAFDALASVSQGAPAAAPERFDAELRDAAANALRAQPPTQALTLQILGSFVAGGPARAACIDASFAQRLARELVPQLTPLVDAKEPELRRSVAPALARAHDLDADAALARLLADHEPTVRVAALDALSRLRGPLPAQAQAALLPPLAALADGDSAFGTRQEALDLLAQLPPDAATRALARALGRDPYALVREVAAKALAQRPGRIAETALSSALRDDREPRVRIAAARALVRLGGDALAAARALPSLPPELRRALSPN